MNKIGLVALAVIIIIVAIVAVVALRTPPAPTGFPTSTSQTYTTVATTSVQAVTTKPYLSASQAASFIGTIIGSGLKVATTPAGLAQFGGGLAANATSAWMVSYNGTNNAGIAEIVVQSVKAQSLFYSFTSNSNIHPGYITGSQNGMNYIVVPYNQTTHQDGLMGWKGNYVVLVIINNESTVNMNGLAATVSGDLP